MINAEDFLLKCKHCGWHVIDQIGNMDYVCEAQYKGRNCYADCKCKYYKPEREDEERNVTENGNV